MVYSYAFTKRERNLIQKERKQIKFIWRHVLHDIRVLPDRVLILFKCNNKFDNEKEDFDYVLSSFINNSIFYTFYNSAL